MERVLLSVALYFRVHIFAGILGCAKTESVESEGVFIASAGICFILSAGVHLAENKLPVIFAVFFIEADGDSAAEILNLNRTVKISCYYYSVAVAFPCLIY